VDRRSQGELVVVGSQHRVPDAEGNQGAGVLACSHHLEAVDTRDVDNWPVGSQEACNLEVVHHSPVVEDSHGLVEVHSQ